MKNLTIFLTAIFAVLSLTQGALADSKGKPNITPILITIDNQAYATELYDNPATLDLIGRLPLTLSLSRGGCDYCGDIKALEYVENQVQNGYQNGDLAYWVPGQDFVIFLEKAETGESVTGVVVLGRMLDDYTSLFNLERSIEITLTLAERQ